jgi:hypothetical protein
MASVAIRTASISPLARKRAMWPARRAMKAARPSEVSQTQVAFRRKTSCREASLATFRDVSRPFVTETSGFDSRRLHHGDPVSDAVPVSLYSARVTFT